MWGREEPRLLPPGPLRCVLEVRPRDSINFSPPAPRNAALGSPVRPLSGCIVPAWTQQETVSRGAPGAGPPPAHNCPGRDWNRVPHTHPVRDAHTRTCTHTRGHTGARRAADSTLCTKWLRRGLGPRRDPGQGTPRSRTPPRQGRRIQGWDSGGDAPFAGTGPICTRPGALTPRGPGPRPRGGQRWPGTYRARGGPGAHRTIAERGSRGSWDFWNQGSRALGIRDRGAHRPRNRG